MSQTDLNKAIIQIGYLEVDLRRLMSNTKKRGVNNFTVSFLKERLNKTNSIYNDMKDLLATIQANWSQECLASVEFFSLNKIDTLRDFVDEIEEYLNSHIQRLSPSETTNLGTSIHNSTTHEHSNLTQHTQLPIVELPHFDGRYDEWANFRDNFTTLIHHNSSLTNIQKFHYLSSCLRGEARFTIQALSITSENYNSAWLNLTETYENERIIVSSLLSKLTDIKFVNHSNINSLKHLRFTYKLTLDSLINMGINIEHWDPLLIHLLVLKFDDQLSNEWRKSLARETKYPDFKVFDDFVLAHIRAIDGPKTKPEEKTHVKTGTKNRTFRTLTTAMANITCILCKGPHKLLKCDRYISKTTRERSAFVKSKKLCVNCLSSKHALENCPCPTKCLTCGYPHHTSLHYGSSNVDRDSRAHVDSSNPHRSSENFNNSAIAQENVVASHVNAARPTPVLLATAMLRVSASNNEYVIARVLFDSGSEVSFVSDHIVQLLGLDKRSVNASVSGIGTGQMQRIKYLTEFTVSAIHDPNARLVMNSYVLPNITNYSPKSLDLNAYPEFLSLSLADPYTNLHSKIEILIGIDYLTTIFTGQTRKSLDGNIMAQSTIFGWVISGKLNNSPLSNRISVNHCCDLNLQLRRFWEEEEIPCNIPDTVENDFCEKYYTETTSRDSEGRFIVRLPFKDELMKKSLGQSRKIALASLQRVSQKLNKDNELKVEYNSFMSEYSSLGHMTLLSLSDSYDNARIFLPHHPVITTVNDKMKLRIVFNGSSKTSSGLTLNDTLHIGPKLQSDITSILLKWRLYKFVFTADIVKMFRQILVHSEDRVFQNIIWKDFQTDQLLFFQLNTVTYGLNCAPFLALRSIRELVNVHANEFSRLNSSLLSQIYVDDLLLGEHTKTDLFELRQQVVALFKKGRFELSKWSSNIQENNDELNQTLYFDCDNESNKKVLGIKWDSRSDCFLYSFSPNHFSKYTKRIILSEISKLFDPMGFLSAVTIRAKHFMQSLWLHKTSWDEELPSELVKKWCTFYDQLHGLNSIKIARWNFYSPDVKTFQLIGFCDASSLSYSAVIYSRIISNSNGIEVSLLMAKTKVAPIKTESIPRLELRAAALLTRLLLHVKDSFVDFSPECICFSDSQVTLAWLAKHPSNWQVFVANRVSYIQTVLPDARWSHVASKQNPADLNSRGISVDNLINSELWWKGPQFLHSSLVLSNKQIHDTQIEIRKQIVSLQSVDEIDSIYSRFSSWSKMLRILSYVYRFYNSLKRQNKEKSLILSVEEIERTKSEVIKSIQKMHFLSEINSLCKYKAIKNNSNLIALSPFVDKKGLLRLGGRLRNSLLNENEKHPIILPKCHVSKLIIRHCHLLSMHGGTQLTMNLIRKEFWIIGCRNIVKFHINKCVPCIRERADLSYAYMSDLPRVRCVPSRPFSSVGIDLAGPMMIRDHKGRGIRTRKSYIVIFVCLSTRAVHIELITGYDAESLLAGFNRFTSRRGLPKDVYSDNGRNLVAVDSELRKAFRHSIGNTEFLNNLATSQIQWHFIPPASPHWGGIWESGIKSIKFHLKRVMGKFTPTWEEMITILCRIEACMNSRPIAKLHEEPDDLEMLTPGHFLIGTSLLSPPEPDYSNLNDNLLSRWRVVSKLSQQMWKIWSNTYLSTLQSRNKWQQHCKGLKKDDIVLIKDNNNPPCRWSIGRIILVHPSQDGVVRVVTIKTPTTTLKRNVTQLCKLFNEDGH